MASSSASLHRQTPQMAAQNALLENGGTMLAAKLFPLLYAACNKDAVKAEMQAAGGALFWCESVGLYVDRSRVQGGETVSLGEASSSSAPPTMNSRVRAIAVELGIAGGLDMESTLREAHLALGLAARGGISAQVAALEEAVAARREAAAEAARRAAAELLNEDRVAQARRDAQERLRRSEEAAAAAAAAAAPPPPPAAAAPAGFAPGLAGRGGRGGRGRGRGGARGGATAPVAPDAAAAAAAPPPAEASRGLCVICDEQAATWALLDCGHKVLCETCVRFFEAGPNGEPPRQTACPMCREPVARTLRIWD